MSKYVVDVDSTITEFPTNIDECKCQVSKFVRDTVKHTNFNKITIELIGE